MGIFSFLSSAGGDEDSAETREEESYRRAKDIEMIAALRRNGSDLGKLHIIEHHFFAGNRAKADAAVAAGLAIGYKASEISSMADHLGITYWHFDLIKAVIPSEANMLRES